MTTLAIPTEPIGSIPRPPRLIEAIAATDGTDPDGFRIPFAARARVLGTALASKELGIG